MPTAAWTNTARNRSSTNASPVLAPSAQVIIVSFRFGWGTGHTGGRRRPANASRLIPTIDPLPPPPLRFRKSCGFAEQDPGPLPSNKRLVSVGRTVPERPHLEWDRG